MKKNLKVFVLALVTMFGLGMAQDFGIASHAHAQSSSLVSKKQLLKQIALDQANMALVRANQGNLVGTITNIDACLETLGKIRALGVSYDKRAMDVAIDHLRTARALAYAGLNNIVRIRGHINIAKGAISGI